MSQKIVVTIEPTTEMEVFVARSWQKIPDFDVNILDRSIISSGLKMIDRLDELQEKQNQNYWSEIANRIGQSAVVVAVLLPDEKSAGISRNVIYELGLADSLGKPTVIIANSSYSIYESVSDLAGRNLCLVDSNQSADSFKAALTNAIRLAKERGEPEYLVDRKTYQNITVVSGNDDLIHAAIKAVMALIASSKIKFTFTAFRNGSVSPLNQNINELKSLLSTEKNDQSIVQRAIIQKAFDEFTDELILFEDSHDDIIIPKIIEYSAKLKELLILIQEDANRTNVERVHTRIAEYKKSYTDFSDTINSFRKMNKLGSPSLEVMNDLNPHFSKLKDAVNRIILSCESLERSFNSFQF